MITFDADFNDVDLATAVLERGVKTQPLSWHSQRRQPPGLVLGYGARTPTEITEAITSIGETLRTR